ncbi:hypothetical protein M5K25_006959 [Dendrobium thyrsiflorum]|uniref:RNase H type-1 domain-containing protein n=1 Tax=Dendrobium thyrsiflorum TaxID=117978 RepID=A0ABD0VCY3_DENTH
MDDFNNMILECKLLDIGFSGNLFTWNRGNLWQRLDRILFNDLWINSAHNTSVDHLSKTLSDHSPLLICLKAKQFGNSHCFRFQNMWLLDDSFNNMVRENWKAPLHPDDSIGGMKRLWFKLKRLKQKLNWWNKSVFKNVLSNIIIAEDKVSEFELSVQANPSDDNVKQLKEAKSYLFKIQEQVETFWKQKSASKHLLEGISGLSFNKNKCIFVTPNSFKSERIIAIKNTTGFKHSSLPIKVKVIVPKSCGPRGRIAVREHPNTICYKSGDSSIWKRLCSIKHEAEQYIRWGIGKAEVFFWQDKWVGNYSIDQLLNTVSIDTIKVKDFLLCNRWNVAKLAEVLPDSIVNRIVQLPLDSQLLKDKNFKGCTHTSRSFGINLTSISNVVLPVIVCWVKPSDNWVKINTDGSVKANSWGCGGIIRDSKGNLFMAYATPLVQCSIIFAELAAILHGLKMCLTLGLRNIWIEFLVVCSENYLGGWVFLIRWMLNSYTSILWFVLVYCWATSCGLFFGYVCVFLGVDCHDYYFWCFCSVSDSPNCFFSSQLSGILFIGYAYVCLGGELGIHDYCLRSFCLSYLTGFVGQKDASDARILQGGWKLNRNKFIGMLHCTGQSFRLVWLLGTLEIVTRLSCTRA